MTRLSAERAGKKDHGTAIFRECVGFAMAFEQELHIYLRSRFTLIALVTTEEERALQAVKRVCEQGKRPCITWDVADGFRACHQL